MGCDVKTILPVECNSCGLTSDLAISRRIPAINTPKPIRLSGSPCPCGGTFSAMAGKYDRDDETGVLRRTGEYTPHALH